MRSGILALTVCALLCFGLVSFEVSASRVHHDSLSDDIGFVETESVEGLEAAAAELQKQAAAQALLEQTDPETEAMTHVFREDQFKEEVDPALVDTESTVDARVEQELEQQIAQHTLNQLKQEAAESAEIEEYLAEQSGEASTNAEGSEDEVLLQSSDSTDSEEAAAVDPETAAARAVSSSLEVGEDYPVMIESSSQSHSAAKGVPEVVSNAWHSAVKGAKGMMHKLKNHISSALSREHAHQPTAHSFLASRSNLRTQHAAKGGDQWWLEKAPWFLPPPPEWGPMPVTMYTSYFHKPIHPHHLDYAHGIPLPHAEALNLARRTYPQPPFEQQAAGESFMEVSSESHMESPLDDSAIAEIAALSDAEDQALFEEEPALIQLTAHAMMHTEADGQSVAEAQTEQHAEANMEVDRHPNFIMDDAATVAQLDSGAVEAMEVEDLTNASPLKEEEILSVPM